MDGTKPDGALGGPVQAVVELKDVRTLPLIASHYYVGEAQTDKTDRK